MEGNSLKDLIVVTVSPALFGISFYFIKNFFKENKEALSTMEKNMHIFMFEVTKKVEDQGKENKDIARAVNEKLHSMALDIVSIKRAINEEVLAMKERLLEISQTPAHTSNEKLQHFINAYKENTGKLITFMEEAKGYFGKIITIEADIHRHEALLKTMYEISKQNVEQYQRIKLLLDSIAKKKSP